MPAHLHIMHLADVPEAIPILVRWFIEEWAPYYGADGPGDARGDLAACCNRDRIPLALVALDANQDVIGTAALKEHSLDTHRHLGPWLAAIIVSRGQRGKKIGTALVRAIEDEACRLGFGALYTATRNTSKLVQRPDWEAIEEGVPSLREPMTVYRLNLDQN